MLLFTVCLLLSALALMALPGLAVGAEPKAPLANYPTAQEAQQHCPDDLVVCVCRNEANKAGIRATRSAE
jgi:hypothetical protein